MAIRPTEDRNIANYARKIVGEKLIMERRRWETMRDNKQHPDVVQLGAGLIESYRGLMIGVTAVDLLDSTAATINVGIVNTTEQQDLLVRNLSRYLLLELSAEEFNLLIDHLANVMVLWTYGATGTSTFPEIEDEKEDDTFLTKEVEAIAGVLQGNAPYITLILLADLHHMTYVASAEQCLEILSST